MLSKPSPFRLFESIQNSKQLNLLGAPLTAQKICESSSLVKKVD